MDLAECTVADCSVRGLVPLPPPLLPLPAATVAAYLRRLGVQRPAAPTRQALAALLAAHVDR